LLFFCWGWIIEIMRTSPTAGNSWNLTLQSKTLS
jgi:hypothetical protein